jgi:pantetheine-phosphate adenylyltransferase
MRRAVCPGSFDPVTLGHLDVIGRATGLADEVWVAVGDNMSKTGLFTPTERVSLLEEACAVWPTVRVALFRGLLVDFCRDQEADLIVKGLRSAGDFAYEQPMAQMNRELSGVETVFLVADPAQAFVSSSLVREVAKLGGDVSPFVPAVVERAMLEKIAATARRRSHDA